MRRKTFRRRIILIGMFLSALLLTSTVLAHSGGASSSAQQVRSQSFQPKTLQHMIAEHQLASTVQALSYQPPSVILQFRLFPSGSKKTFPKTTGVVTIVKKNPAVSLCETKTVDAPQTTPHTIFT